MKNCVLFFLMAMNLSVVCGSAIVTKRSVSIEAIHAMCDAMYKQIVDTRECWQPECLVGLSRGGLVPLGFLAGETMFNIRDVTTISVASYSDEGQQSSIKLLSPLSEQQMEHLKQFKTILVIDDIADSGKTLAWVVQALASALPDVDIRTAVLFYKEASCAFKPDYYVEVTEDWIVFPWEKSSDCIVENIHD